MPRLLVVSFAVCPAPDRHGVQLLNLLKALSPRFDVDVLTLRVGDLPFVDRLWRARMLRVPVGLGTLVEQAEAFRRAVRRQLEGEEYDIVHLRSAWGAMAVRDGAPPSTQVVYEIARSTEGEPATADRAAEAALAEEEVVCFARADLIVAPGEVARRHLVASGRLAVDARGAAAGAPRPPNERLVVVPPGVDVDHFDWEPRLEHRPRWLGAGGPGSGAGAAGAGAGREPLCVLFAGRVGAGRGVRLLLRAVGRIERERPGAVRLCLAGPVEPGFRETLERDVAASGVARIVDRLGPVEHDAMPRVIAQAAVCVSPSAPEPDTRPLAGCPIKVLEYMACRRAVVAPRTPVIAEVLRHEREGLLFEPGSDADLASKLGRLLDDADLRKTLASSAYRVVRSRYPAAAARRLLLEAYARLAPPSSWTPPGRAAEPIGDYAARLDSSTARHEQTVREAMPVAAGAGEAGALVAEDAATPAEELADVELVEEEGAPGAALADPVPPPPSRESTTTRRRAGASRKGDRRRS